MYADQVFWIHDPLVLIDCELIPDSSMSTTRWYNTLTRLILLLSVFLVAMRYKNAEYYIAALLIVIIALYYLTPSVEGFINDQSSDVTIPLDQWRSVSQNMFAPDSRNRFCNNRVLLEMSPAQHSNTEVLHGPPMPKTRIKPIVVPPPFDFTSWSTPNAVPSGINDSAYYELSQSGYLTTTDAIDTDENVNKSCAPGEPQITLNYGKGVPVYTGNYGIRGTMIRSTAPNQTTKAIPVIEGYCQARTYEEHTQQQKYNLNQPRTPNNYSAAQYSPDGGFVQHAMASRGIMQPELTDTNTGFIQSTTSQNFMPTSRKSDGVWVPDSIAPQDQERFIELVRQKPRGPCLTPIPNFLNTSYSADNLKYDYPVNFPTGQCQLTDNMKDYNKRLFTVPIEPGVYARSQIVEPPISNIGIDFAPQFPPVTRIKDGNGYTWLSHDPTTFVPPEQPIVPQSPEVWNVYDPRGYGYGSQSRTYYDAFTGQIKHYYDDVDAIRQPQEIKRSDVDIYTWSNEPGCNRQRIDASYITRSQDQRGELMERYMRKYNTEIAYQRRLAPLSSFRGRPNPIN